MTDLSRVAREVREEAREVDYPSSDVRGYTAERAWLAGYEAGVSDATARYDELLMVFGPRRGEDHSEAVDRVARAMGGDTHDLNSVEQRAKYVAAARTAMYECADLLEDEFSGGGIDIRRITGWLREQTETQVPR